MHLLDLPQELLLKIFKQVPQELRPTCRAFSILHNDYYRTQFLDTFGDEGINKIIQPSTFVTLVRYVQSLDYWLGYQRRIIQSYYSLKDVDLGTPSLDCSYIADSWQVIFGLFKNRRLHINATDYEVNRMEVSTSKRVKLSKGLYNLTCGVILRENITGISLSCTVESSQGEEMLNYGAPSNLNELVPFNKFVIVDMGDFEVVNDEDVVIKLSESINRSTSDYIVCYVDVNAYSEKDVYKDVIDGRLRCKNEKYWIAWWVENQVPDAKTVVNVLLRDFYYSLENNGLQKQLEDDSMVDVATYSQQFYRKINEDGELIERVFKFRTQNDRKRYKEWKARSVDNAEEEAKWVDKEPLKWKMGSIMSV